MNNFPIEKFLGLVELDRSIVQLDSTLEKLNQDVQEARRQYEQIAEFVQKALDLEKEQRKRVDELELRMSELDDIRTQKLDKLDTASNEKEYIALKNEIDATKQEQHELEAELLSGWKSYESARIEHQRKAQEAQSKQDTLDTTIQEKMKEVDRVKSERATVEGQRPQHKEGIPEEWLEKYALMHKQVADPVVPVENEICTACFYNVLKQDMIDLGRRKMLQCRDCFRFLYLPESRTEQ